ncbi:biotin carboxyl carrier domain-containing protein [Leeia sp. TBRC 13508]|uniref:Biotin carboxyl carrier protein of acetyl-CoA carboxylase n=1 Tax=Leeia speluncae TaxID=2884804 RepID=A0ABS8D4F4_9NEIS|nr:acetyl-CoA carboxylase [Leeia speluncae]MCB6183068.1 biotin carboxyl carrier domain-containing protein [Leeia speluncae]
MAQITICSHLPGTFYRKPSPDAPNFVEEGQAITPGTVIGLVEVMKMYSEVVAEEAGTLVRFEVAAEATVEPGDVLAILDVE